MMPFKIFFAMLAILEKCSVLGGCGLKRSNWAMCFPLIFIVFQSRGAK